MTPGTPEFKRFVFALIEREANRVRRERAVETERRALARRVEFQLLTCDEPRPSKRPRPRLRLVE